MNENLRVHIMYVLQCYNDIKFFYGYLLLKLKVHRNKYSIVHDYTSVGSVDIVLGVGRSCTKFTIIY